MAEVTERTPGRPEGRELPEHVTMPLLSLITQQSLDEDYRIAAERRSAAGEPRGPRVRRTGVVTAVVVAVFGALMITAGVQASEDAGIDAQGRASLIAQIEDGRDELASLQERSLALREANPRREDRLESLEQTLGEERNRLQRLQLRTGYAPVEGPGIRATVDDAPDADETQTVRDSDLALLVNGLLTAGAEAVAINGQRLTALTPITNVGPAIHVGSRPVNPPYTVQAIGDPGTMQADFANSSTGVAFTSLRTSLGLPFTMENAESITLPAAPGPRLRNAERGLSDDRDPTDEEVAS